MRCQSKRRMCGPGKGNTGQGPGGAGGTAPSGDWKQEGLQRGVLVPQKESRLSGDLEPRGRRHWQAVARPQPLPFPGPGKRGRLCSRPPQGRGAGGGGCGKARVWALT